MRGDATIVLYAEGVGLGRQRLWLKPRPFIFQADLWEHTSPLRPPPTPQEGMVLLGQGCDFCCFLFLVCQMQMVSEQRIRKVLEQGGPTKPRNQEDLPLKFHPGKG